MKIQLIFLILDFSMLNSLNWCNYQCIYMSILVSLESHKAWNILRKETLPFVAVHIEQIDFLFSLFLFTAFLLKFRDRILNEKSNVNLEPEDLELLSHERTITE